MNQSGRVWFVVGHFGGSNVGDDAMLLGLLELLDEIGDRALVLTKGPNLPDSRVIRRLVEPKLLEVLRSMIESDGLILGGGTHFHDDYSLPRFLSHLKYMGRFVGLTMGYRIFGKPSLWLGMGFGPATRKITRFLIRLGIQAATQVTTRDTASLQLARSLCGKSSNVRKSFDLAACLPAPEPEDDALERDYRKLGMSITSLESARQPVPDQHVVALISNAILLVANELPGLIVELYIFRGGNREGDLGITSNLKAALENNSSLTVHVVPYISDPHQILASIARCDLFMGMRYHSVMLAYLARVPTITLAYHDKNIDLSRELGISPHLVHDARRRTSSQDLAACVSDLIRDPDRYWPLLPVESASSMARSNLQALSAPGLS